MIFGYIRVSTDKQTVENQRFEIIQYAKKENLIIDEWIEETISGTISPKKRNLGKLIQKVNKDDIIICTELSRLGRTMFMIMSILNNLMERQVKIFTIKEGYKLGDDLSSKVMAFGAHNFHSRNEWCSLNQMSKSADIIVNLLTE